MLFFLMRISLFLIILTLSISVRATIDPVIPTTPTPKVPFVKGATVVASKIKNSKLTPKKSIKKEYVKIQVELSSGDRLIGLIYVPITFSFIHYKNGLKYNKTLNFKQIKYITINSYRIKNSSKQKKLIFYEFIPKYVTIKMKNKKSYVLNYLFKFLNSFKINTEDGVTRLYSFFGDTWIKDKGWKEVSSKKKSYHLKNAHPQSVVKIKVLSKAKLGTIE